MRTRVRALPGYLSTISRRFATQAVISGTVMIVLPAAGGGAGLYKTIFGPGEPSASSSDTVEVEPSNRQNVNQEKSPRLAITKRAAPTPAHSRPQVETRSKEGETRVATGTPRRHDDTSIPDGVLLFTECRTACESRDPLLVSEDAPNDDPGPVASAENRPLVAEVGRPVPSVSRDSGMGGVSDWLPGGATLRDGLDVAAATVDHTLNRIDAIATALTPW